MTAQKVLIVTGGGRGIGAAIAMKAAAEGYRVAINYREDRASANAIASAISKAGGSAVAIGADVSQNGDIVRLFEDSAAKLGPITHIVNNAGVTGRSGQLDRSDPKIIRDCIDLNVTGALLVAREAIRHMSPRYGGKGGAIVNISSAASTLGSPGEYVWYAASKGAIDSLTIGLAKEVAADGIRVNAVAPGLIDTDIHEMSSGDAARKERIRPLIPLQRIGQPQEVAEAVLFLLSDAASYVTGTIMRVAGGR